VSFPVYRWKEGAVSGPEKVLPVLPVVSVICGSPDSLAGVLPELCGYFGEVILRSRPFPFDMSTYYQPEMGTGLDRTWLCFAGLRDPSELSRWKLFCFSVEESRSGGSGRTVNLDPGYLDHGKLVLASFKPAPDKVYMGHGVWAHTCLRYRFGDFCGPDHSFPDFIDGRFNGFFKEVKSLYRRFLRDSSTQGT